MPIYKIISTNTRIVADQYFCEEYFPNDWEYEGEEVVPPQPILPITKLQYMERFTDEELAAIYTLAKTNVQMEIWLEKFKATTEVNLTDSRTVSGIQSLVTAGILTEERATEILTP
jgi:hypothetical protein